MRQASRPAVLADEPDEDAAADEFFAQLAAALSACNQVLRMRPADGTDDDTFFDQLILEFHTIDQPSSGWIHCSVLRENRGEVLRTADGITYLKGLSL